MRIVTANDVDGYFRGTLYQLDELRSFGESSVHRKEILAQIT